MLLAVLVLAGCEAGPGGGSGGGGAAGDGQAGKLRVGSSENDAFAIFGPDSGFERNPANWDQSCLSYAYGSAETPRYVHAVYENGALVRATDGHTGICTFADAGL